MPLSSVLLALLDESLFRLVVQEVAPAFWVSLVTVVALWRLIRSAVKWQEASLAALHTAVQRQSSLLEKMLVQAGLPSSSGLSEATSPSSSASPSDT